MIYRIKANSDFRRLYGRGKSLVGKEVVVYYIPTKRKKIRFGVTCGKKVGGAVVRNRAKRVLRAAMMSVLPKIGGSYDIILVARAKTPRLKSTQVSAALEKLLVSAGLIN